MFSRSSSSVFFATSAAAFAKFLRASFYVSLSSCCLASSTAFSAIESSNGRNPLQRRYPHPDAHRILRISNIGTTDISSFVCFFSCSVGGYFAIRPARSDRSMAERVRMAKIADELRLSATRADGLCPSLTAPILNDSNESTY